MNLIKLYFLSLNISLEGLTKYCEAEHNNPEDTYLVASWITYENESYKNHKI